jgi:hypothetical protein
VPGPPELSVALEFDLANAHALQERENAEVITEAAAEQAASRETIDPES